MAACRHLPPKPLSYPALMRVWMMAPHSHLSLPVVSTLSQTRSEVLCKSGLDCFVSSLKKKIKTKGIFNIEITFFYSWSSFWTLLPPPSHRGVPSSEPASRDHLPQSHPTTMRMHQSHAPPFQVKITDLTVPHNLPHLILQHPIFSLFSTSPHFSFSFPITYSLDAVQTSVDLKCPCNILLIPWLNNKKSTE